MFFLATADAEGRPQCSYKGGEPGFVRVLDERTVAFPNYDGNGMFLSAGNALVNPHVGLLFIDFEQPEAPAAERRRLALGRRPAAGRVPGGAVPRGASRRPRCSRTARATSTATGSSSARASCRRAECETPVPAWKTRRLGERRAGRGRPGQRSGRRSPRTLNGPRGLRNTPVSGACPGRARGVVRARRARLGVAALAGGPARARGRTRRADDDADRPDRRRVARRGRAAAPRRRQLRGRLRQRRRARLHAARRDRLQHARRAHAGDGRAGDRAAPRARPARRRGRPARPAARGLDLGPEHDARPRPGRAHPRPRRPRPDRPGGRAARRGARDGGGLFDAHGRAAARRAARDGRTPSACTCRCRPRRTT